MRQLALAVLFAFAAPQSPDGVDPTLRVAVERFYAMQEAEDIPGYMALWSQSVQDPQRPTQLRFIFDSGDDKFSDLTIASVRARGNETVVRLSVTRDRTTATRRPDGTPLVFHSTILAALTYVREGGEWKLVREGTVIDALADAVIAAPDATEREKLLAEDASLVNPLLVAAIARQADAAAQRRDYPRAQALYERALELAVRIDHKKLQAEALQNLGNALYYQRNFAAARPIYEQSVAVQRELGNDEGVASALVGLGTAQYSQFEYSDALLTFHDALAIQERLDDRLSIATTLISTGNIQLVEGEYAGAITDYRRSRLLYRAFADTRGEARALDGLGRSYVAQGDLAGALEAFTAVLDEGRSRNDPTLQGTALLSLGDVHFRLGNLDTAREFFDQSRIQFEKPGDLPNVGHAWQALAMTDLVSGRFAAAEDEYSRSSAICAKAEDADCSARGIVGLAFAQSAQEHYALAIGSYRKAIAAFTVLKKREDAARAEIGLSQALAGNRQYADAISIASHARSEGAAIGEPDIVWRSLVAQGRAQRRLARADDALGSATEAVKEIERMLQDALDGRGDLPTADSASAYALLAVLQAEANDPPAAFATVERRRAHSLRVALARNERDISRGMTAAEQDNERQLAGEVVSVRAQLDHEKALPKPDAARLDRLQQRLRTAVEKRTSQRSELFTRLPDLRTWRGLESAVSADEAARVLMAGEALAEFVIDDEDLLVVFLTQGSERANCRVFLAPVTRHALAERIAHAVEPAGLRDVATWQEASADLLTSMPEGAITAIASAPRAILVPDDVLWRVPFEALPLGEGFLADRTTILYAGSATSLVRVPPLPSAVTGTPIVVGPPQLTLTVRDRVRRNFPGWPLRSSDSADAEVHLLRGVFEDPPPTVLSGEEVTETALRRQAAAASVLHIAAPFRINGASPLFSTALLTPDSPPSENVADVDGALEAREVMNLDLHAAATVFSDGTSTSMRNAAPAIDLVRWAWRAAGVPTIVLSRWATEDDQTVAMLKEFYGRVRAGDPLDVALQGARMAVRGREGTSAPYFWAGWMVVGR
jgi:tetratricopeptide (TPR) repeat protein